MKQTIPAQQWSVVRGADCGGGKYLPGENNDVLLRLTGTPGQIAGLPFTSRAMLILDMQMDMDSIAAVNTVFHAPGEVIPENEEDHYLDYRMIPQRRVKLAVRLEELNSSKHFLDHLVGGMLEGHAHGRPARVEDMDTLELEIFPLWGGAFRSFTLFEAYLTFEEPDMTVEGAPMVDAFGQWMDREWEGKVHSEEELVRYLRGELESAQNGGQYPEGFSRWGGWLSKKFDATGFFHTHHDGRRWWLVDPDGYAFFSNGMCYGSRMGVFGFTDRRESLFSWLPQPEDPTYRDAWTTADQIPEFAKRNGPGVGADRKMFNFARANLIRAFGPEGWWDAWVTINAARLKNWGFNTIGVGVNNYEDERVMDYLAKAKIPFVWTLKKFPRTNTRIFRDFPDVYSEEFSEGVAHFAQTQLGPLKGNPYLIGYFVNNEPEWKTGYMNLAERAFAHPQRLRSKEALVRWLQEKYGTPEALSTAWKRSFSSFEDLFTPAERLDALSEQAAADFAQMHALLIDRYSEVLCTALKRVDPDHLDLGLRYAGAGPRELAGSEKYDVFSFNCYRVTPRPMLDTAASIRDLPMMIGEWHIGGGSKGLLGLGLLFERDEETRAKACDFYFQEALTHPNCVGIHYFEMNNQPLLGRFDGESMEHGVIDVCNRPYAKLMDTFTKTARRMYELLEGQAQPDAVEQPVLRRGSRNS